MIMQIFPLSITAPHAASSTSGIFGKRDPPEADKSLLCSDKLLGILARAKNA
jgi:hypothetical protein